MQVSCELKIALPAETGQCSQFGLKGRYQIHCTCMARVQSQPLNRPKGESSEAVGLPVRVCRAGGVCPIYTVYLPRHHLLSDLVWSDGFG